LERNLYDRPRDGCVILSLVLLVLTVILCTKSYRVCRSCTSLTGWNLPWNFLSIPSQSTPVRVLEPIRALVPIRVQSTYWYQYAYSPRTGNNTRTLALHRLVLLHRTMQVVSPLLVGHRSNHTPNLPHVSAYMAKGASFVYDSCRASLVV